MKAAIDTDYIVGVFWWNPVDTIKGFENRESNKAFLATVWRSGPACTSRLGS